MSMRRVILALCLVGLASGPVAAQTRLSAGGNVGYVDGFGLQLFMTADDFAEDLPVSARLRLGRTYLDPGSSSGARRIFINNATNGTPEKSGRTTDVGLDVVLPRSEHTAVWAGVRYSRFKGNFRFVGGNEDFDVTSAQWGLGAGWEFGYAVAGSTSLLITAGLEYYRSTRLSGHDTSYSPDGDNVNPREDFNYGDANDAVHQPSLRPVIMLGLSRAVGGR